MTPKVLVQRGKTRIWEHKLLFLGRNPEADLRVQKLPIVKRVKLRRVRRTGIALQKGMEVAQDGTPPHAVPSGLGVDDRVTDDDAPSKPTHGLAIRLAVAVPQEHKVPQEHVPLAPRHRHLEPPRAAL